jgi:pimeloyl-ACP methyl ester carboxylesterase
MRLRTLSLVVAGLVGAACADSEVTAPTGADAPALTAAAQVQTAAGELGPGALYQIIVPPAWNGTLVLYAHGYAAVEDPPRLPDPTDPTDGEGALINGLTQLGFAVAYSSFSENGFAVKDGAQRTKQLRGIFVSKFGQAARTILFGTSLGGEIVIKMVEDHPELYAGAFSMCGIVGGSQAELDYLSNVRVLFDVFYPGVITGDLFDLPPEALRPLALAAAAGALEPIGLAGMQAVMAGLGTPIPGTNPPELVQSILTAVAFNLFRFDDLLDRTNGQVFFDNTATDYGDPAVNAAVDRFTATPKAVNHFRKYYQPTGDLQVPVVTLHTSDDPQVPVFHEALYAGIVGAAGNAAMLDQIIVPRYGHCTFTGPEVIGALGVLLAKIGP